MRTMHADHVRIVSDIQVVYKEIEDDSTVSETRPLCICVHRVRRMPTVLSLQVEFRKFIFTLRDQYSQKLLMHRNVIEALRLDVSRKERYLEDVTRVSCNLPVL